MRKITIKKELICPFSVCRIHIFDDEKYEVMSVNCQNCEYVWDRKSTLMVEEGCVSLDENSKEYKEYEMLHTPTVVDSEEINNMFCMECGIKLSDDRICRNVNCCLDGVLQ
mgnify:CR=1 FL=1